MVHNGRTAYAKLLGRLDLKSLRLFVAICEEGTLTGAAHREAIAPSAVSKRLQELETNLGCELMLRDARGMRPTAAGETLLRHTRRMLAGADRMLLELGEHARGARGIVRILANLSAIVEYLPEDLQSFLASHPETQIDLEERPSEAVVNGVLDGLADFGICAGEIAHQGLETRLYRQDRLVLAMRPDHPLAAHEQIDFAATLDHDFVGLHVASSIHRTAKAMAERHGRVLRLRVHVPGFDAVCRMVQADMGLGLVPAQVFNLFGGALSLVSVPLTDAWAHRELRIVMRDSRPGPSAEALIHHLSAMAQNGGHSP